MKALTLSVLGLAITAAVPVDAQTDTVRSGQPKRIWTFFDCQIGRVVGGSGTASNGSVEMRQTTQNRCGHPQLPVLEAIYTSRAGFKGTDTVYLYYGRLRRRQVVVNVH